VLHLRRRLDNHPSKLRARVTLTTPTVALTAALTAAVTLTTPTVALTAAATLTAAPRAQRGVQR
jgi:hypothetical protein